MNKEKAVESPSIVDRIWNLLVSIKLAVVVFSIISLTSIVGTIIEQGAEPEKTIQLLSKLFGSAAPTAFRILDSLGFTDMYRSWWFVTLLFIFAANLILCSIDRLPRIWKVTREPIKPLPQEMFNTMSIKGEHILKEKLDKSRELLESALKKVGFKPFVHNEGGIVQIYAERGRYSRLGVYVTHFSILIILIGAIIGIFFGFNGGLNLPEGATSQVAYAYGKAGKQIPLGFGIRCDDFEVSFYENSDTPKEFKSWLTVIDDGKEVIRKEIEVNVPLKYKGITFYQSSYGYNPSKDSIFKFSVASKDGKREDIQIKFDQTFVIPGTKVTGKIINFSPALAMDQSGRLYTYAEMMHNPAVFIEFSENGKTKYSQWILKRYPQTWKVEDGIVEFKDLWGAQFTGLQVRKDPGVPIVYLGCIIMGIGLYAAFFMSHQRVWVRLSGEKNNTKVTISASANKNRASLQDKIEKILKMLKS